MALSEKILKHQKALLLALALVIILTSVVSTLWWRGVLFSSLGSDAKGYQNITLTDAVITCENETRSIYKNRLRYLTLDNLSSRYENSSNLYKVYFAADVQSGKDPAAPVSQFIISCLVGAKRGNIREFEAFEKKESRPEAVRKREGGVFGWPL